jgi:plasmid stability protein
MKQLTIRGFDEALEQQLRKLAAEEHLSLNKAVLKLLKEATGLGANQPSLPNCVGDRLDAFIGVWSEQEEQEFNTTVAAFEQLDEDLWK